MELKKLREMAIADAKEKLSVADEGRRIVSMFRQLGKIGQGISSLKDAIKENAGIPFEADEGIFSLESLRQKKLGELEKAVADFMPETSKVAGAILSAKLLEKAGSLKKLAEMPSSKIQLLGAEKALFRHLRENKSPPKHGAVSMHESVTTAENKGKAARQLANAISKAVKVDYYRKR